MTKLHAKWCAWIISIVLLISCLWVLPIHAATRDRAMNLDIQMQDGNSVAVHALQVTTAKDLYVSLRDMAVLLRNSEKCFTITINKSSAKLVRGQKSDEQIRDPFSEETLAEDYWHEPKSGGITIDDHVTSYPSIIANIGSASDCYMRLSDFVMMADVFMEYDGTWHLDPEQGLHISLDELLQDNYFEGVDSVLVGDATTGEVYFSHHGEEKVEIASTTKLITYLVIKDALNSGEIDMSDEVVISENAALLSQGEDGVIKYEAGKVVSMRDLLIAILLPSSNESALALAEHLCGSEEAFVERMIGKLESLGIYDAQIYNCHGLPIHSTSTISSKNQNRISAEDMFKVVCCIMEHYPEILEITDLEEAHLDTLMQYVKNTNGVIRNMPEANGLKTGTTSKSGACLVATCAAVDEMGKEHTLVAIEYGAESNTYRVSYGEVLLRYAKQEFANPERENQEGSGDLYQLMTGKPDNIDKLLWMILNNAKNDTKKEP